MTISSSMLHAASFSFVVLAAICPVGDVAHAHGSVPDATKETFGNFDSFQSSSKDCVIFVDTPGGKNLFWVDGKSKIPSGLTIGSNSHYKYTRVKVISRRKPMPHGEIEDAVVSLTFFPKSELR